MWICVPEITFIVQSITLLFVKQFDSRSFLYSQFRLAFFSSLPSWALHLSTFHMSPPHFYSLSYVLWQWPKEIRDVKDRDIFVQELNLANLFNGGLDVTIGTSLLYQWSLLIYRHRDGLWRTPNSSYRAAGTMSDERNACTSQDQAAINSCNGMHPNGDSPTDVSSGV